MIAAQIHAHIELLLVVGRLRCGRCRALSRCITDRPLAEVRRISRAFLRRHGGCK